jgi:hypothetical protein
MVAFSVQLVGYSLVQINSDGALGEGSFRPRHDQSEEFFMISSPISVFDDFKPTKLFC